MSAEYFLDFDFESHYDRRWIKLKYLSPKPPFEITFGSHRGIDSLSMAEFNDHLSGMNLTKSDIIFDLVNAETKERVPIRIDLSKLQKEDKSKWQGINVSKKIAALMKK
jgi:hypothetical protein